MNWGINPIKLSPPSAGQGGLLNKAGLTVGPYAKPPPQRQAGQHLAGAAVSLENETLLIEIMNRFI